MSPPRTRRFEGHVPELGARVYIDPAATVIGRVRLGDDVSVWPGVVIRGDINSIEVGARTNIQDGSVLHVTHDGPYSPGGLPLSVGADVTIGHRAVLHACTVGARCLIGMGALLLDGAIVEDEVLIGAGTVVPPRKRLKGGSLWIGHPAERLRALTARELESFVYSAAHYVRVKDSYLAAGPDD